VTGQNAALVQHFLNVTVTERKTVVQSDSLLRDDRGKAVAVGLDVRYGWSAYPEPVKATQPVQAISAARCNNSIEQSCRSTRQQERSQIGFKNRRRA